MAPPLNQEAPLRPEASLNQKAKRKISPIGLAAFVACFCTIFAASHLTQPKPSTESKSPATTTAARIMQSGTMDDAGITESSGLAASRSFRACLWTHNDSGSSPTVFLLNASGKTRARVTLQGVTNRDWEDMAVAGKGSEARVYIGEIGDNAKVHPSIEIYRFREAQASEAQSRLLYNNEPPAEISIVPEKTTLLYPDGAQDAETLIVADNGVLIIVTKSRGVSSIYKSPRPFQANTRQTLVKMGEFRFGATSLFTQLTTGGDLSPDGKRVLIRTYTDAYEWKLPAGANAWRDVWKSAPRRWSLPLTQQGEAICYSADGKSWFASSEGELAPLLQIKP
jgi:hypothetical protein